MIENHEQYLNILLYFEANFILFNNVLTKRNFDHYKFLPVQSLINHCPDSESTNDQEFSESELIRYKA